MKYCKCDDFYMARELEFVVKDDWSNYYIKSEEQKKHIKYCPFCGKKLK